MENLKISDTEQIRSLLNIGNIFFIENNLAKAYKFLYRAYLRDPYNKEVKFAFCRLLKALKN